MKTRKSTTPPASPQSPLIRVSVDPSKIGHRIAEIGPGGVERNVEEYNWVEIRRAADYTRGCPTFDLWVDGKLRVQGETLTVVERVAEALRGEGDPTGEAAEVADSILGPVPGDFAGGLDAEFLRRFWGHAITPAGVAKGYLEQVRSRMLAEEALDASDPEIERTLRPCVCGHLLVPVARYLRDHGYSLLGFQVLDANAREVRHA